MQILTGVMRHIFLLLSFQHDGRNLPKDGWLITALLIVVGSLMACDQLLVVGKTNVVEIGGFLMTSAAFIIMGQPKLMSAMVLLKAGELMINIALTLTHSPAMASLVVFAFCTYAFVIFVYQSQF